MCKWLRVRLDLLTVAHTYGNTFRMKQTHAFTFQNLGSQNYKISQHNAKAEYTSYNLLCKRNSILLN